MAKIKRSLIKSFLNTGTPSVPIWSLISAGVPTGTINMNPKTSEETYIGDDNATIMVESYSPTMPVEATAVNGDAVFEWLDAARKGRDTLEDAETELVNVWLYETASLGYYTAEKVDVSLQCDSFGGEGGNAAKLSFTINYIGDPVLGSYNPTDEDFVANPVLAGLTSLVFSVSLLTLSPTFATNWLWYETDTSDATNVITAVAEDAGAVIAIDVDGVPVANGDPATWSVGLNIVTVEVTVGAEVVEYIVEVTYTP